MLSEVNSGYLFTVSYTHLDVYKRQEVGADDNQNNNGQGSQQKIGQSKYVGA